MTRPVIDVLNDSELQQGLKKIQEQQNCNIKKVLLQLNIAEKDKNALKSFFAAQGVSMTDGLIKCFYFVKNEVENGHAEITRGGIYKK